MESNKILQSDLLDILFENRNKEYGAYDLRRTYNRRLYKAIAMTGAVIGLVFIGGMVSGRGTKRSAAAVVPPDIIIATVDNAPPPPPPPPPPPLRPETPRVEIRQFTPPRLVDEDVKPDEKPPEQTELDDVKIGATNVAGEKDDGTAIAPPAPAGNGKVIEEPKKKEDDGPDAFMAVEVEADFPGGSAAWLRFLLKNLNYPQDAINNEIQGMVVVQFIVDEKGNVSNVQAIGGPESGGLREEAVRVIRKSGLWTPALQNGRHVKSYKRQPITFAMPKDQ